MRLWLAVSAAAVTAFVVAGASGIAGANTIMRFVDTRTDPGNNVRAASGELDFLPEFLTDPQADKSLNSLTDAVATPAISAHDVIVGEGDGIVDLPVTLSAASSNTVSVKYATANSSAAASTGCSADYRSSGGMLEFAPNVTTMVVHVEIFDCADVEGLQSFTLELSGAAGGATIGRASGRVGIVDNDAVVATPRLFVRDAVVDEKDGTARVVVLLGGPAGLALSSSVTVDYTTGDGTAAAPGDYVAQSGTLTFAPGETAKTIVVAIADDGANEPTEDFLVSLSNASPGVTIADSTARVVIGASDAGAIALPRVSAQPDVIVGEGDGFVDLVVSLSVPAVDPLSVSFTTANSSATASTGCSADYDGVSGTLNFAPGETTKVVRVDIFDCADVEGLQSFTLELSGAAGGATIGRASGRVGIVDNDAVVATPRLFVRDAVVDEKDGTARVVVLLGGPAGLALSSSVTVDYMTGDGTAAAPGDYVAQSGTLTFAPGETAKTIVVAIADDGANEPTEDFLVSLSNASPGVTIADSTARVVIGASDAGAIALPRVSAQPDVIVGEGDGFVDLVVSLSVPAVDPLSVSFTTANSSATASTGCSADYDGVSGTLNFAPGETTKVVRVDIFDCADVEGLQSFTLELSGAAGGATIGRASGRVGIVDNDAVVATPRLFVRDAVVDEKDGTARVVVLLGGPAGLALSSSVTVDYTTGDGTAAAPGDYVAQSGTLTFAPGETAKTIVVAIADDGANEPTEDFLVSLSNASPGVTIADSTARVVIGASDGTASAQPSVSAQPDVIVGERDGFVDLVVSLSTRGTNPVSVNFTTANSSATASTGCSADYDGVSGTLNFAPGETTKVVRVDIFDCDDVEGLQSFTLELSGAAGGATIGRASGRVGIVDNDAVVATPRLFVRDAVVDEKDGTARVVVLLGGPAGLALSSSVTVDYTTGDGTAAAPGDYVAQSGTLTFAPGETAKTIVVAIADDGANEPTEDFLVSLSNASPGVTIADGCTGIVLIGASDGTASAQPSVSAQPDVIVGERDGFVDLVVSLSTRGTNPVSVNFTTANGSAVSSTGCNADYDGVSGTLNFAPGETTKVVRVDIFDCAIVEALESFTLELSAPGGATIARASGRVKILDNDIGPCRTSITLIHLAVTPEGPSIAAGTNQQFTATATYSDASTADLTSSVTWASASPAVATVSAGGLAHAVSPGTSTISATLGPVSGSTLLTVDRAAQSITFAPLANKTYGDPDFTVSATANSGLTVAFAGSGNCTVTGTTVHITGAGSCTITASQAGNETFNPAPIVPQTFSIAKAPQTITVSSHAPPSAAVSTSFTVAATASSSLAVSYSNSGACTNSGATFTTASSSGTCTVKFDQSGNANYNAAVQVSEPVTVTATPKIDQTITLGSLGNKTYGEADFAVSGSASSGLTIAFAASGNCTVTGTTVHITGAGSCTLTASQAGNANYNPAPTISQTFSIAKASQTITFGPLANKTYGDPDFTVSATANSGLTVAFAASGSCTVSAATVHITGVGSCTVSASQSGNANYNAAPAVSQTFSISRLQPPTTCTVPKVVGKRLGAAKLAIKRSHCRTGKVGYAYSRKSKKGIVISQSRRAGQVLPANSKINLVVSRGRKR